jgi:hypothetical protein
VIFDEKYTPQVTKIYTRMARLEQKFVAEYLNIKSKNQKTLQKNDCRNADFIMAGQ